MLIFDGAEQIPAYDFFNVSGYCFGLQLAKTDIYFYGFVLTCDDGHPCIDSCGQIFDFFSGKQPLGELLEEVSFPLYEAGTDANEINITAVGTQIKHIAAKG